MGRTLGTARQKKEVSQSVFMMRAKVKPTEPEEGTHKDRKRSFEARKKFFLVLCRLRRAFAEKHLAHLFHI